MTDTTDKALDARIIRANPIAGMDAAPDGRWVSYEALIDLRRECDALRAQLATARADAVRVKPLVWEDMGDYERAPSCVGVYEVGWNGGAWAQCDDPSMWEWSSGEDHRSLTTSDAKAAAQADYEARIIAALEPAPSAPSPEAVARAALEDAVAEALYALSWAKANLADYSFQIGEGRKDFPVLDRALARAHAAIVAKAGGGE